MAHVPILTPVSRTCRLVAAALIAGVHRRKSLADIQDWITGLTPRGQFMVVGSALGLLAAGAFVAAQIGWIAMLAYWMIVVLIVN